MKQITSAHNEALRRLGALADKKGRAAFGRYAVEGVRALSALPPGVTPLAVWCRMEDEALLRFAATLGPEPIAVPYALLNRACDSVNSAGIVAEFALPTPRPFQGRPLVVADGLADMGNLGTLLRTGVAMGVGDFLLIGGADPYAPKCVRAAMGATLSANILRVPTVQEALPLLNGYRVEALDMAGQNIFAYRRPAGAKAALAVGGEATGLSAALRARADVTLSLPMPGGSESLNAAVSACSALIILTNLNSTSNKEA